MSSDNKEKFFYPKVILLASGLTGGIIVSGMFYKNYLKRINTISDMPSSFLRRRSLLGHVTSVGDGDGFHFYHTPGGRLAGWGVWRKVPTSRKELKDQTFSIRISGIDAPERAHFGHPAQPFSEEAFVWLKSYILGRRVRIRPLAIDQYRRLVARSSVFKLTGRKDVGAELLRNGLAVVYEGKTGAEFDGQEDRYRQLENVAKRKKKGMWSLGKSLTTPGEYKKEHTTT